jgi:hypothetical protein
MLGIIKIKISAKINGQMISIKEDIRIITQKIIMIIIKAHISGIIVIKGIIMIIGMSKEIFKVIMLINSLKTRKRIEIIIGKRINTIIIKSPAKTANGK